MGIDRLHLGLLCADHRHVLGRACLHRKLLGMDMLNSLLRLVAQLTHLQFALDLHLSQRQLVFLVATILKEVQQLGQTTHQETD